MITLNLIPEEVKKHYITLHIYSVIRNNLLLILIATTIVATIILLGRIYLERKFIIVIENTTQVTNRINSPITQDIIISNEVLKSVKKIQDEYIPWQTLLVTLSQITPNDVAIRQIQITQEKGSLALLGTATNRDDFLLFKNNIESNPLFLSVDSPISNILNKTNINFTLGITLDTNLIQ